MKVLVADDEPLALKMTVSAVSEAIPDAEINQFSDEEDLFDFAEKNTCDIAFLDINMRGITGLEIAKKLKALNPRINIIFVTGYDEYKGEAMDLKASGYILKPVEAQSIVDEMNDLRYPISDGRLEISCFGNFSVKANGSAVRFDYDKTKELLAYLVNMEGATCTYGEISAVLWEDDSHINYLKKLKQDLISSMKDAGYPGFIVASKGKLGLNTSGVHCDYWEYLKGTPAGLNAYRGEYMNQYSWAENTNGRLLFSKD